MLLPDGTKGWIRDIIMRICIFGAGAVGSHIAVRLARAGHEVSCVMRGAHLEAARANGLKLRVETEQELGILVS